MGVLVLGGGVGLGAWYLLGGKGGDDTRQASSQTQVSDSPSQTSPAGQPEAQAGAPVTATPISDSDRQSAQLGTVSSDCQSAPSVDDAGRRTTFDAANATDGDPATAWRCDGSGGGTFRFTLAQPTEVMDFGLIPGYAKTDPSTGVNRFHQNHTVTEATWTLDLADGGQLGFTQAIDAPSPDYHFMRLSQAQQVTGGSVTITGTGNPGAIRDFTPVSEIVLTTTTPSYNGE